MSDEIKKIDESLLLAGLKPTIAEPVSSEPSLDPERRELGSSRFTEVNNPPVLNAGDVKDNNLTNQDGQPLENNPQVSGDTNKSEEPSDTEEKFKAVKDHVSGNVVIVRTEHKEEKNTKLQELLKSAHDSLGDRTISEIGLDHPYWSLMQVARKFQHDNSL